jgi:hypothetical protein
MRQQQNKILNISFKNEHVLDTYFASKGIKYKKKKFNANNSNMIWIEYHSGSGIVISDNLFFIESNFGEFKLIFMSKYRIKGYIVFIIENNNSLVLYDERIEGRKKIAVFFIDEIGFI